MVRAEYRPFRPESQSQNRIDKPSGSCDSGRLCELVPDRCRTRKSTCHHILPSSQVRQLFYDPSNLQAASRPCDYGGGAEVASNNRENRQLVEHHQRVIEQQQDEIEQLRRQLEELERPSPHRTPAIR